MTHRSAVHPVAVSALALSAIVSALPVAAQSADSAPSSAAPAAQAPILSPADDSKLQNPQNPQNPTAEPLEADKATDSPPAPSPPPSPPADAAIPANPVLDATPTEPKSWFYRAPLTITAGHGDRELALTLYGVIQSDFLYDTTRSFNDTMGGRLVARSDTFEGTTGRTQASSRNTRLGLSFRTPTIGVIRPSAVLEADFLGNQPSAPPSTTETAYFESGTFRLRHAFMKLENPYVDLLIGQTYDLFGWQNYFDPATAELGMPNRVLSRHTQLRLSHTFGEEGPVALAFGVAATRPAQRDSQVPDLHAGIRLGVNGWKGITTQTNTTKSLTKLSVFSLGVSGVVRQFKVDAFAPPPTQSSNSITAWGASLDALIPVIPAADADDRGNKLTLTASFVIGSGIADLIAQNGGARFPTLPNPALMNPAPEYIANIDDGLVTFDRYGVLHTIDWQAFRVGLQYYLPPNGRVSISLNYTQAISKNMRDLYPQGGAEIELLTHVAERSRYADANLFWYATPSIRFGLAGSYSTVDYLDGDQPHNIRGHFQAVYLF